MLRYNRAYFIQQAPAFYANGKNATKLSLTTGEIEPLNSIWLSIFVSQFNSSNSSWTAYKYNNKESQGLYPTITDDPESGKKIYTIDINIPSEEKFLKIWHAYNSDLSVPCFYYNGTQNSGSYDFLLANGSSKESVVVSSDAPVFVYTLVTQNSYDEIKDWSREDWEWATKHIGDTQIDFNSSSRPVNYQIPVSQINRGEHYVVVVHYANGKATMSEIMQK